MNFDKDDISLIITGSVVHDDEVNHLTVREDEWKLKSKIYEVHMTCGGAKLSDFFPYHNNKSFYRSYSNKCLANFALMGMLLMPADSIKAVYENNMLKAIMTIHGIEVIFDFKSISVAGSSAAAVRARSLRKEDRSVFLLPSTAKYLKEGGKLANDKNLIS